MCQESCTAGSPTAAALRGGAASELVAKAQELRRQLREAASELSDVDTTIAELQEELQQFQVRRAVIARKEASLREQVETLGLEKGNAHCQQRSGEQSTPKPKAAPLDSKTSTPDSKTSTTASSEPITFSLDDDAGVNLETLESHGAAEQGASMDDWEQGLEILSNMGSRDRAARLRARWMMSTSRDPKQAARK